MTDSPARLRVLKVSIVLAVVFNVFALLVLFRPAPILFTLFMFLGQPLSVLAVLLLLGAVAADLRARGLF